MRTGTASIGITWFAHRRTTELTEGLGIPLFVLETHRRGLLRYVVLTLRTIGVLQHARPSIVLVQNPSLVLSCLAVLLRTLFGYRLIVDAHNEAVQPYINTGRVVAELTRWVLRKADLTIVTNPQLADLVVADGGRPFVLPDRVPQAPKVHGLKLGGVSPVVLICTYAPDEPVREVLEAVRDLDITLYVTGNKKKCDPSLLDMAPSKVLFTGFLKEDEYWEYLAACDGIVDLTTMPNCLVCGGYEAAALGQPLLLSRSAAASHLFGDAALYTDNTPGDIRRGIAELLANGPMLRDRMRLRAREMADEWDLQARKLTQLLQLHCNDYAKGTRGEAVSK